MHFGGMKQSNSRQRDSIRSTCKNRPNDSLNMKRCCRKRRIYRTSGSSSSSSNNCKRRSYWTLIRVMMTKRKPAKAMNRGIEWRQNPKTNSRNTNKASTIKDRNSPKKKRQTQKRSHLNNQRQKHHTHQRRRRRRKQQVPAHRAAQQQPRRPVAKHQRCINISKSSPKRKLIEPKINHSKPALKPKKPISGASKEKKVIKSSTPDLDANYTFAYEVPTKSKAPSSASTSTSKSTANSKSTISKKMSVSTPEISSQHSNSNRTPTTLEQLHSSHLEARHRASLHSQRSGDTVLRCIVRKVGHTLTTYHRVRARILARLCHWELAWTRLPSISDIITTS